MYKASDLKNKEIINLSNNEKLGYMYDFEIEEHTGEITAIYVPDKSKSFLSAKKNYHAIPWSNISGIGEDIILVKINLEV